MKGNESLDKVEIMRFINKMGLEKNYAMEYNDYRGHHNKIVSGKFILENIRKNNIIVTSE